jgi:hypothetical protein
MFTFQDSFAPMESLFREWLTGARDAEVARLLHLVAQELERRGFTFVWHATPPLADR